MDGSLRSLLSQERTLITGSRKLRNCAWVNVRGRGSQRLDLSHFDAHWKLRWDIIHAKSLIKMQALGPVYHYLSLAYSLFLRWNIGASSSQSRPLAFGVPQGSVLGTASKMRQRYCGIWTDIGASQLFGARARAIPQVYTYGITITY